MVYNRSHPWWRYGGSVQSVTHINASPSIPIRLVNVPEKARATGVMFGAAAVPAEKSEESTVTELKAIPPTHLR